MKTLWAPTNEFYREIIAAPSMAAKEHLYRERFIQPWKPMMERLAPMFNAEPSDDFAVARGWGWVLPEGLESPPEALLALEAAGAWEQGAQALATGAARFEPFATRIPFDQLSGWLVVADPARSDPLGWGYTGATDWTQPRLVVQYDTPNAYNLPRLPGAVVHELHHLIRMAAFPWDMMRTSVADYIILEGLAESFAAALFGEEVVGYYVTDFEEGELEQARRVIREGLARTGFDVIRGYIFGDRLAEQWGFEKIGMPAYGGYAIGYRVVQAFLRETGTTIEEATFLPADTIVEESAFFRA